MSSEAKSSFRRTGCFAVIILALAVGLFLAREVYLALTATPGSAVDYVAKAQELVESYQPTEGENGWVHLVHATERAEQVYESTDESRNRLADSFPHVYTDLEREPNEPSRAEYIAIAKAGVEAHRKAGVWDAIDQLADSPRVVRPKTKEEHLHWQVLRELGSTRQLARVLRARMKIAHDGGDDVEAANAFGRILVLGHAVSHQLQPIDHLIGTAVDSFALLELCAEMVDRPLEPQALEAIADSMDRFPLGPWDLAYKGERLVLLGFIQPMYTDDGHGDGRLIISNLGNADQWNEPPSKQPVLRRLKNLTALLHESKKQTTDIIDAHFALGLKCSQTPRQERIRLSLDPDAVLDDLPDNQDVLSDVLIYLRELLQSQDLMDALFAGTRIMVAVELYNARHEAYPDALDDVVPEFLPVLPTDPYAPDGRFVYRRVDPDTDPYNRRYLLYSVGTYGQDDGGYVIADPPIRALQLCPPGTDYVFNLPRPALHDDGN